jgi:hypothetical protein
MSTPSTPAQELSAGGTVDAQIILNYASSNSGKRVGTGECFDLADKALRKAGAKSAADFGPSTGDADYIWGIETPLDNVQVGDIIQFRNYRYDLTEAAPDDVQPGEAFDERPHHTAIVKSIDGDGKITVWEQNIPPGSGAVKTTALYFKSFEKTVDNVTTKVTVSGTVKFYRPQPRSS